MIKSPSKKVTIFWFRRDLRLEDNTGLHYAVESALASVRDVVCLFIFDKKILSLLEDRDDKRVFFIHQTLCDLKAELRELGSDLYIEFGDPQAAWKKVLQKFDVGNVFSNRDYEPYAVKRDREISEMLGEQGIEFHDFKDQVIFEKSEVQKDTGGPYTVYTPYSKKWKRQLAQTEITTYRKPKAGFHDFRAEMPTLKDLGFAAPDFVAPQKSVASALLEQYENTRNFPALPGTSRFGLHLRFGTVSVRKLVRLAEKTSSVWLGELIWREFFMQILWHFPHVVGHPFKPAAENIKWRNNEKEFALWCEGRTGYPIVDAGMRELNATGFMHNRVRMIAASLLCKHLLIDWRWGEAYFARKLLDFELASNNGNWQWVAGTGCDSAPYFRVFNPEIQAKKFDPKGIYQRKWLGHEKLEPIVDHAEARVRVLRAYKEALGKKAPEPSRKD